MKSSYSARALACALAVLPGLVLAATHAEGAGYAIREQSGTGLGNAFAGAPTGIDDPTFLFSNPASMTYLQGNQVSATGAYIIPDTNFKDGDASAEPAAAPPFPIAINETSSFDDEDIGRDAFVPALSGVLSLTDDLKLGLSINVPFGLLTDNPGGWVGRYHAEKSQLKTININPAVAYRVNDFFSVGAGFSAIHADAELSNAIDFGTIGAAAGIPGAVPTTQDGRAKLTGDDWGFGGNLGIMLDVGQLAAPLEGLRFGAAYRSHIKLNVNGDTDFDLDSAGIGAALRTATGAFADTDARADLDLPETVSFGLNYDLNDEWAFMGQAEWTNWSRFDELVIEFDNSAQADSVTEEDWNDSWFFAVGTTYRPRSVEGLTLRLGLAHDQTPVPDRTRTPRIPDEDRYWVAVGAGYKPYDWLSLDLSYTHIFLPDAKIDLDAGDEGNTFRGNLSGEYNANIDIIAFQGTIRF